MDVEAKKGSKWTKEETILAFDLYCKTPFSKIGKSNRDIIMLAELIGRTPSSVGLKMANLASFDPTLSARHVKGMSNASKLDKEVFEEFSKDWEGLSYQAELIKSRITKKIDYVDLDIDLPNGVDREIQSKQRVGQYFFRSVVLSAYGNKCCVTGLSIPELLVASHIKPWAFSDQKTERTNPSNGLSLNAFHDKAFDKGLITIDKTYKIIFSKRISEIEMDENTLEWFNSYKNKQIILPEKFIPDKRFIEYHNDFIFQV